MFAEGSEVGKTNDVGTAASCCRGSPGQSGGHGNSCTVGDWLLRLSRSNEIKHWSTWELHYLLVPLVWKIGSWQNIVKRTAIQLPAQIMGGAWQPAA